MQNPLRRRNRALTPDQYEELQKLVFDLVRERLVDAFGAEGMWSVSMKNADAVDSVFSETVAETLAWEVAAQLAAPKKSRHEATPAPAIPAATVTLSESVVEPEIDQIVEERLVA